MRKILWTVLLSGAMNLSAFGALYRQTSGFQNVTAIPDGSATGWSDTVLLNQPGAGSVPGNAYGSGSSGLDVTLAIASPKIHSGFRDGTSGSLAPEGRNIEPLSVPSEFNSASTAVKFSSVTGQEPKGNGTMYFANAVSTGGESSAVGWALQEMTVVPEPINVALGIFGALFLAGTLCRSERVRKLFAKPAMDYRWRGNKSSRLPTVQKLFAKPAMDYRWRGNMSSRLPTVQKLFAKLAPLQAE